MYTFAALPEPARNILALNPMCPLMNAYQQILLDKTVPASGPLLPLAVLTVVFLLLGAGFFLARVGELVDEL